MKNLINNKYTILGIIAAIANFTFYGCYSSKQISREDTGTVRITKIKLVDGTEIDFTDDKLGYAYFSNDEIVRFKLDGEEEIFPLNTVDKIYTEQFDVSKTVVFGLGVALGSLLLFSIVLKSALGGKGFGG